MKKHKHIFTPITTADHADGGEFLVDLMWEWCIRCGALRLDKWIYLPGPKQKKTIVESVQD